jgi:SAM-dependent methyltransferase
MTSDMYRLVRSGYDDVADVYMRRFGISTVRQKWLDLLLGSLPVSGGRVLDLGCGAGIPVTRDLAAAGHIVIGVDGSPRQLARARRNVPAAMFVEADMCKVAFAPASFDAVGAFYAITHVPPVQQRALITSIATWLRPGGTLIASFGTGAAGEWTGCWLGTRMFFGHAGEAETLKSLSDARLLVRHALVEKQDNEAADFLWIDATKDR